MGREREGKLRDDGRTRTWSNCLLHSLYFLLLLPLSSCLLLHHKLGVKSHFHLLLYLLTPSQPSLRPPLHWGWRGSNNGTLLLLPPPPLLLHPPPHLWVPLCLVILLPNRSIIGPLSLVNVASDTSDGSFMHAAGVRRKVGAGVEGGCIQWGGGSGLRVVRVGGWLV